MSFYVQFEKAAWLSVVTALDSQSGSLSFMSSSHHTHFIFQLLQILGRDCNLTGSSLPATASWVFVLLPIFVLFTWNCLSEVPENRVEQLSALPLQTNHLCFYIHLHEQECRNSEWKRNGLCLVKMNFSFHQELSREILYVHIYSLASHSKHKMLNNHFLSKNWCLGKIQTRSG